MATQVGVKKKNTRPQQSSARENELEVLNPDCVIAVGGRDVTVREYGHIEWFKLLTRAEPIVQELVERKQQAKRFSYEDVLLVFSEHMEQMLPMVLQSADMKHEEFDALQAWEMEVLLSTWWGVNHRFFWWRAQTRAQVLQMEKTGAGG